ncbi:hypothetical protein CPT_Seurat37 [Escherichia phage Seurat]|uniref:Uncharacterized protein n=1 Tax=Escherichia phage Seurat TaxID=1540098 RepID=A0A0A0RP69_9CAUD|nr:hypothetical protein CPT_Seurat37 [Escherichia phage Seurat]AIW03900.1 hypothetical protein CPT_Seurat37 [Escherichia phage Seurat]
MKDNLNKIWHKHDGKGMPIFLQNEQFEVQLASGNIVKNYRTGWDWYTDNPKPLPLKMSDVVAWRYIVAEDYVKQSIEANLPYWRTDKTAIFTKYEPSKIPMNKYQKVIYGKDQNGNVVKCIVDVYDVLEAWKTTNPALQHLIKKALQPGERGHKGLVEDLKDIIASAQRALEIEQSKEVLK